MTHGAHVGNGIERSLHDIAIARLLMPGGVNSPVRAMGNVHADPVFYDHAKGSRVWDVDGNEYVDMIGSWGPMILGHADERIVDAIASVLGNGLSFGAPCEAEIALAEMIVDAVPNVEMVRMVSSGTEATMSAIRLARGFTGRDKIVKFEGNYHGHSDSLLVDAGSGVATLSIPGTPGVTARTASDTIVAPYNDVATLEFVFSDKGDSIACVIVEPIAGNMGVVPPAEGFLEGVRRLCSEHGSLLVFDEVITGFRCSYGGAQELFGIDADIVTFGKIIGGGLPVGCIAGPRSIMSSFAPVGDVYQAGTLSGNPLAMTAGATMLRLLAEDGVYEELERKGALLQKALEDAVASVGAPCVVQRMGSVATLFFRDEPVRNWRDAADCDTEAFARYYGSMREAGFLVAPSQYEAIFLSTAHADEEIAAFGEAARRALDGIYG